MFVLFLIVGLCLGADKVIDVMDDLNLFRTQNNLDYMNNTFFSSLENVHEKATEATEKTYPWIAQVIHSRTKTFPYMCTAICVQEGIFMTASRCIYTLKVMYTTILYHAVQLPVEAFVVPTNLTLQQYDDIAFLVVKKQPAVDFVVAQLYSPNEVKRTDDKFNWFLKVDVSGPFRAIGYGIEKSQYRFRWAARPYNLVELPVEVNIDLCWTILTNGKKRGFRVPCYNSCNVSTFKKSDGKCGGYLGIEGAAVMHEKTKKVLGIATWGPLLADHELPVGFAVVNSNVFLEDLDCAKKVRDAIPKSGSYQDLCKL